MRWLLPLLPFAVCVFAADNPPKKPVLKITPGQVIVPADNMRRIWGELVSVDVKSRTGTFRNESTDEVMPFTVMPYAELLHHAAFGELDDYRIGERAIFRMHPNEDGKWIWLTYIQDEMNFLNGHKEYYWVDRIDAAQGQIEFTQANADKSFVREKGLTLLTDKGTRYWKNGQPAKFSDIQVGDKLRTKTHGTGKGKVRMCWEVFLDDASLLKFQSEQQAAHKKRMTEEGLPGYVDSREERQLRLTMFQESREGCKDLKAGSKVRLAPAGVDRKPTAQPLGGTMKEIKPAGNLTKMVIVMDAVAPEGFKIGGIARVWAK